MYSIEKTADPNTIKVIVEHQILERGSQVFESVALAAFSPLGSELMKVSGIKRVELSRNSIVLTKSAGSSWETVQPVLKKTLDSYFA